MSRDLARERLKEIRTLQGFEAAYKAAGLPQDGAKRNTQVKRLSRLINRKTGGFQELDSKQRRRINRTFKTKTRQKALREARADAFIRKENKVRKEARKEAREFFGEGGVRPNPAALKARLAKFKNLSKSDRDRWSKAFEDAREGGRGAIALRREYARTIAQVPNTALPPQVRKVAARRLEKAERAAWRESGSKLPFNEWRKLNHLQRYSKPAPEADY
jgi:hypothetical protein